MKESEKSRIFTAFEKKGIYNLSGILFFRMFSIFVLLPVFSILSIEMLVWEDQLSLQKKLSLVGLSFGIYGLTQCLLQIPFGMLSDRIGRKKVIVIGLCLFIIGNVFAAIAESVYFLIFARFIQGTGAISSTIFALIADLTRPEVRTRANAAIGISIGFAFASAFALSSFLGESIGLDGIFWLITFLSVISLFFLIKVPSPEYKSNNKESNSFLEMIYFVWKMSSLRTISWGGFVCGLGLSSTFFMMPLIFSKYGIEKAEMWQIYLPMLILGGLSMVFASALVDLKNCFKEVMFLGIIFMLISIFFLVLGYQHKLLVMYIIALYLFFMGFNVFEPILPSLVSRITSDETKGTAVGVYNFAQFFGHFLGATLAGILFLNHYFIFMFFIGIAEILFFYLLIHFQNPKK
tara:strand:+ start:32 stop:1249 length:1218 start_codon:yes stop_codon:yes gene_type:complete